MLFLLVCLLAGTDALTLTPGAFVKLNDSNTDDLTGTLTFGNQAATASAYDPDRQFLYVIGTGGDVLNIIAMNDPANPRPIKKIAFDGEVDGFPDAIAFCSFGNLRYLAVSFENLGTTSLAYLKIYRPLDDESEANEDLQVLYNRDAGQLDGYDPTEMAWTHDCSNLVVIQQGRVHLLSQQFDDPFPRIDILNVGATITRTPLNIDADGAAAAGARHVLRQCEDDSNKQSTRQQDLEPRALAMDYDPVTDTDTAYIAFSKNNVGGKIVLGQSTPVIEWFGISTKDWKPSQLDTADDDSITLNNYPIRTFYQPADIAVFRQNGEVYIATADSGEYMSLSGAEDDCQFDESTTGMDWIQTNPFGGAISDADKATLNTAMADNSMLGAMRFTKIRDPSDGWDVITQGFNYVTSYGGRGFSILKVSTEERVYESGDKFESIYTPQDDQTDEAAKAVFNADVGSANSAPSSRFDKTSLSTGPTPRAVVVGEILNTTVVVVSNGYVGGLYYYTVDDSGADPLPTFQGFIRRGNTGRTWQENYRMVGDMVGEPEVKHIQWIDNDLTDNQAMIAVMANRAGVVSFYNVILN